MTNTKDIIIKLKEVKKEKNYSITDIENLLQANNEHLSRSTISRIFADGSEETSFRYEETIRPIANALLDIETIEETDDLDIQAMKSLLKYKAVRIKELEHQIEHLQTSLDKERIRGFEKFEAERNLLHDRITFLTSQIEIKDKRMDEMKAQYNRKDELYTDLVNRLLNCHACSKGESNESV